MKNDRLVGFLINKKGTIIGLREQSEINTVSR